MSSAAQSSFLRQLADAALGLCFPSHCVVCRADTPPRTVLCSACEENVEPLREPYCQRCSAQFEGAITQEFTCENCHGRDLHFTAAVAAFRASGAVRECVHHFKYSGQTFLREQLGRWLVRALEDPRMLPECDAFIPVPLHHIRYRERRFNQAELLAEVLAKHAGRPMWDALRRVRYTTTQTRLERAERMENLRDAFRVKNPAQVKNRRVVLVDDVFTTGSTVEECSRVLLAAGAADVRVITVARA